MPRLALSALFLIPLLIVVPSRVRAQSLTVTIIPAEGVSGTSVTLRGQGAHAREPIIVFYAGLVEGDACAVPPHLEVPGFEINADAMGRFTVTRSAERTSAAHVGIAYAAYSQLTGLSNSVCFRFRVANSRTFPETGQTLSGRFLQFWEENGGLPTYGYPITPARNEVNPDTRQAYLTQWVERNRMELHPENRAPYDVLLGRLGADRLRQIGRDWRAEGRESGPKQGCLWFPETGHNVCNQTSGLVCFEGFADYWRCHGLTFEGSNYARSLALFGLPLTEARMETNSSGDRVLTQWFERARFEWHADQYGDGDVLLGLLGREVTGIR